MISATEVRAVSNGGPADQILWRLSEPIEYGCHCTEHYTCIDCETVAEQGAGWTPEDAA